MLDDVLVVGSCRCARNGVGGRGDELASERDQGRLHRSAILRARKYGKKRDGSTRLPACLFFACTKQRGNMVKYANEPANVSKSAKVRLRRHACSEPVADSSTGLQLGVLWGDGAGRFSQPPRSILSPLQARGSDLRVHFKNTREAAFAVRGKDLSKAKRYLEDVIAFKRAVPFRRYNGAVGRTSQAANEGHAMGQGRWPVKSAEFILGLLKNAESNAEVPHQGFGMGLHGTRAPQHGILLVDLCQ